MRAEELPERGHEVPGRQAVQVRQRQHLADLRGLARPRRQDRRAEPLPLACVRVGALVVHPGRGHLHRPGAGQHRPRPGGAVAHHHPPAILIAQPRELVDVGGDLGLQRRGQHLPGAVPHDLVDQRRRLPISRQRASHVRHYCEHGCTFPARRSSVGHCLRPLRLGHPGRYTLLRARALPGGSTGFKHCSGYRESAESRADLLRDAARRGMRAPVLAAGDGALGFWGALREVFPQTREQRCWSRKSANVLAALPKSAHPGAKKALAEIWGAEDKSPARQAVTAFDAACGAKFPRAAAKITDDIDQLLASCDYPAEHWVHLRTTNPIESTFATVRHRTKITKGPGPHRVRRGNAKSAAQGDERSTSIWQRGPVARASLWSPVSKVTSRASASATYDAS